MRADLVTPVPAAFGIRTEALGGAPAWPRVSPPQRSTADRLREALLALGDHRGQVLAHRQTAWSSITFTGSRHTVTLLFAGEAAVAAGERVLAELPDHEFSIPGQIVAEALVTAAAHRLLPAPRLDLTCELLLVEDA